MVISAIESVCAALPANNVQNICDLHMFSIVKKEHLNKATPSKRSFAGLNHHPKAPLTHESLNQNVEMCLLSSLLIRRPTKM